MLAWVRPDPSHLFGVHNPLPIYGPNSHPVSYKVIEFEMGGNLTMQELISAVAPLEEKQ